MSGEFYLRSCLRADHSKTGAINTSLSFIARFILKNGQNQYLFLIGYLESPFVFGPVLVLVAADLTVWLPSAAFDE